MIVTDLPGSDSSRAKFSFRRRPLARFLADAVERVGLEGEVSVLLTGDRRIRELNRGFRGKDEATDVLSFASPKNHWESGGAAQRCGDVAISLETALRQAMEFGHSLEIEIQILILHGLLHLAGYDHEMDAGEMARRERRLRAQLALPCGLLDRGGAAGKMRRRETNAIPAAATGVKPLLKRFRRLPARTP